MSELTIFVMKISILIVGLLGFIIILSIVNPRRCISNSTIERWSFCVCKLRRNLSKPQATQETHAYSDSHNVTCKQDIEDGI